MVEVLDGLESALFGEFVKAFTRGFIELQANADNIISVIQILSHNSPFPCFSKGQPASIIEKLRARLKTELTIEEACRDAWNYASKNPNGYESPADQQWYVYFHCDDKVEYK